MKRRGKAPPMRLGIDLGTTRTVVAAADRGNYPVVGFSGPSGDWVEHVPTVSAEVDGKLVHGLEAETAARQGAPVLRSWKRLLAQQAADTDVTVGSVRAALLDLATDFLIALRRALGSRSNLPAALSDETEVVISVPANAHSTQRFITLEAFRRAGFTVRAMINEPSAAGLEYAHRHGKTITTRREHVVVYDLGGGTFDSALVRMAASHHDVVCTSGVSRLGGDDFDQALCALALESVGVAERELPLQVRAALLHECRTVKESIGPNTRRVLVDLSALGTRAPGEATVVSVADFYERVRPLVARTLQALEPVLRQAHGPPAVTPPAEPTEALAPDAEPPGESESDGAWEPATEGEVVAGLYVVGGGSGLPLVPRVLRERFGRRVHRSAYPSAATAIGLAIASASVGDRARVTERFTRHLGVFREQDGGSRISFDRVFEQGTVLPKPGDGPLVATRSYRAAHNVGVFRFVECGAVDEHDEPSGDITPHGRVWFPFVAELRDQPHGLGNVPITRLAMDGPRIEERYEVDAAGLVTVAIRDLDSDHERRFVL